jgi:5,10-methylenetetrahydromethanopterin reductase
VRVGVGFNAIGIPLRAAVNLARQAEDTGLDSAWVAEDGWFTGRDAVSVLGAMAAVTERIGLGTNIIPAHHSRHLQLLAATAATLDDLSSGRLMIGIGAGMRWASYPANAKPLQMMRQAVGGIRALISGQPYVLDDKRLRLRDPEPLFAWPLPSEIRPCVPIYLAGRGPRMTALAGEIADGIVIELYVPPVEIADRLERFHKAARDAGRDPNGLEVVCNVHVTVTPDGSIDERLRLQVARWLAMRVPEDVVRRAGLEIEAVCRVRERLLAGLQEEAVRLVTPSMVRAICVAGSPEDCLRQIEAYERVGVTRVVLLPLGGDPLLAIDVGAEYVRNNGSRVSG